ncbi:4Fe-4S binding protein [Candidatus Aerophobetes bacterium]|nr:4Fe-4S binding protein [Candidatus Aerophobetes bacterium]
MPYIKIDVEKCKGCGFCVKFCPQGLIKLSEELNDKGYHPAIFNSDKKNSKCTGCALCALMCPDVCITVYK